MKILVCGGRKFGRVIRTQARPEDEPQETQYRLNEYRFIHSTLAKIVYENSTEYNPNDNWLPTDIVIISGGASGVDSAAIDFAICNYCPFQEYPVALADWQKYGKAAGPRRNQRMLDEGKPDLVLAFPGGAGTADMVRRARQANVTVIEIPYEPS